MTTTETRPNPAGGLLLQQHGLGQPFIPCAERPCLFLAITRSARNAEIFDAVSATDCKGGDMVGVAFIRAGLGSAPITDSKAPAPPSLLPLNYQRLISDRSFSFYRQTFLFSPVGCLLVTGHVGSPSRPAPRPVFDIVSSILNPLSLLVHGATGSLLGALLLSVGVVSLLLLSSFAWVHAAQLSVFESDFLFVPGAISRLITRAL